MKTVEEINAFSRRDSRPEFQISRADEFSEAMQFLLDRKATLRFIEIGVFRGESFRLWAHYFDGTKIGVDQCLPFDGMDSFSDSHGVHGKSAAPDTIEKVETILAGQLVDWLFIDGDHSEPKLDYQNYKRFVKSGGYIGFHDINHTGHRNIKNFWNKLSGEKFEMKINEKLVGTGLGILTKV